MFGFIVFRRNLLQDENIRSSSYPRLTELSSRSVRLLRLFCYYIQLKFPVDLKKSFNGLLVENFNFSTSFAAFRKNMLLNLTVTVLPKYDFSQRQNLVAVKSVAGLTIALILYDFSSEHAS